VYACDADDELIAREEEVKQTILEFYESVKDRISHSSYVIDFYLAKDNRVLIIELNPFHNGAGNLFLSLRCVRLALRRLVLTT
jgi:hypothetical protein